MHTEPHPLAGETVLVYDDSFQVEDWWDRFYGKSWMVSEGNIAAYQYAIRSALAGLPIDDEVVYGKIGDFDHLVHVSELGETNE
jgi:hypothetical protein